MDLLCFATKGSKSNEEDRIKSLLDPLRPRVFAFDRSKKASMFIRLLNELRRCRPDLVVMEGTGLAGGVALLIAHWLWRIPFVVSSGDAVGPFIGGSRPALRPIATFYEILLYRWSAGFIGWTPYLTGRAMTWGAPRAITAAGWAPFGGHDDARAHVREKLGIPESAVVFGLVGALIWNGRLGYCYGYELVRAIRRTTREDLYVVVAGGGSGLDHLRLEAGPLDGARVILPGPVPQNDVPDYLSAMDVLSLPQSVDGVGSFRYTTKLSEYLAARRPVVTNQIPLSYDLDEGWLWRLPGESPWDERFIDSLAALMQSIDRDEIRVRAEAIPHHSREFDQVAQQRRVVAFVTDLVGRGGRLPGERHQASNGADD